MTTLVLDLVMMDVTLQENKTGDFETQLREIDCAIHAVDTVKEIMGNRESKEENRAAIGFSYIVQTEVLRFGGKVEKTIKDQLPYPSPLTESESPFGLE